MAILILSIIILNSCAPQGYIDGQTACEYENERLKNQLDSMTDRYERVKSEDIEITEVTDEYE